MVTFLIGLQTAFRISSLVSSSCHDSFGRAVLRVPAFTCAGLVEPWDQSASYLMSLCLERLVSFWLGGRKQMRSTDPSPQISFSVLCSYSHSSRHHRRDLPVRIHSHINGNSIATFASTHDHHVAMYALRSSRPRANTQLAARPSPTRSLMSTQSQPVHSPLLSRMTLSYLE